MVDIKEIKEIMGEKKLVIRHCTFCDYPCGYLFRSGVLHYDSGCNCVTYNDVHLAPEDDLIRFLLNNNHDNEWVKAHVEG